VPKPDGAGDGTAADPAGVPHGAAAPGGVAGTAAGDAVVGGSTGTL
jgi:hypothetical protein